MSTTIDINAKWFEGKQGKAPNKSKKWYQANRVTPSKTTVTPWYKANSEPAKATGAPWY